MRRLPSLPLILAALTLAASPAATGGRITGRVADEQGQPLAGAELVLRNKVSGYHQAAKTDAQGVYNFYNVPPDSYQLEVAASGFQLQRREVEVREGAPLRIDLGLKAAGAEIVVQDTASLVEDHASVHLDIDQSTIEKIPATSSSHAMENLVLTTPGVAQDENGRFHIKGSHGQVTYVVDGVPVTDQVGGAFATAMDPGDVDSLEVITGGVNAEYGGKPAAVINLTTKSGLGTTNGFAGSVSAGASRFSTFEGGLDLRGGSQNFGYFLSGSALTSDRFLDPVNFQNLHNHGESGRLFSRFDWILGSQDTLRLSLSGGDSDREVPNLASQQANGQDQHFRAGDANLSLGWTHLVSDTQTVDATLFYRHATAKLVPTEELSDGYAAGGRDFPVWASQDRSLDNLGAQASYTQRFGESTFKAGLSDITYPIHENFAFAITDPSNPDSSDPTSPLHPYTPGGGSHVFRFDDRITPQLLSGYAQADLHFSPWFFSVGLRYDRYSVKDFSEGSLQPRLGVSFRATPSTVLRASYDRLFITPENENLALSLSQQAWDLGPHAGTPAPALPSERQDSYSVAVDQQIGKSARFTVEYWEKRSDNPADNEQFLNTGIVFPIAAAKGLFRGWNVRMDLTPVKGWSGYLSLGHTRAIFQAPTVGGLQLEPQELAPGQRFLIDHDQKLSAQVGARYEQGGFYAQVEGRYDSGLVAGDPASVQGNPDYAFGIPFLRVDHDGSFGDIYRVKSRNVWDLSAGQSFKLGARSLELGADLLNVFDREGLYNFLSAFGGTHVIPPRTLAVHLKFKF